MKRLGMIYVKVESHRRQYLIFIMKRAESHLGEGSRFQSEKKFRIIQEKIRDLSKKGAQNHT